MVLLVKNLTTSVGDAREMDSSPGLGRSPRAGSGNHSNVLAWKISWTVEPSRLRGIAELDVSEGITQLSIRKYTSVLIEGGVRIFGGTAFLYLPFPCFIIFFSGGSQLEIGRGGAGCGK